ncbi:MAG: PepSY domain-containing protein, partial [Steroidobacteraceae bacterium]
DQMNTKALSMLALAGLLAGGLASTAFAASGDESREATALQGAKVTLPQAIAIAEQQTGGRAYDAGVDIKGGVARIAVETNGAKGVQTVTVDAQTGQVVGTHAGAEQD